MARLLVLAAALLFLWRTPSYAQGGLRDTSITIVPITLSYAYQLPTGDLAERFGANNNLGLSAMVKFRNNYSLGLEGSFIFGNKVLDRTMLDQIATSDGVIVNQDGDPAQLLFFERGYTMMITAGKLMPILGPNPNSGLLLKIGGGYMRHKIRIESQEDVVPGLEGEYLKGYDRLSAGPAGLFFVGYQHLGNNRYINFLFGFELNLGFTHSLRPFNFDSGHADDGLHVDGLNGLRFGWTLPLYRAGDDRQYYH